MLDRHTDRHSDRQTDRQTDRQADPPQVGRAPGGGCLPVLSSVRQTVTDRQTDSDRLGLTDSDRLGSWTDSDGLPRAVTGPPGRLETFKACQER